MHIQDEYYEKFILLVIVKNRPPAETVDSVTLEDFLKRFLNWAVAPEEGKSEEEVTKCS